MTIADGILTGPNGPLAPTEDKLTEYRVEIVVPVETQTGIADSWDDIGVLAVAKRTQGSTVLQRAGELIKERMGPEEVQRAAPIRFRVWPVTEQWEGQLVAEPQPPLFKVLPL